MGDCAPASTPVSRYVGDVDGDCAPASTPVSRYVGDVDGGTAHPQVRQSQGM